MRTTITLEDDVAAQLEQLRRTRGGTFKDVVNDALRAGLVRLGEPAPARKGPFTRPQSLGRMLVPNLDCIAEGLAVAEGEDHK